MRARVLTAIVLAAVLISVLLLAPAAAVRALFGLFVLAGAWEWAAFAGCTQRALRMGFVVLIAALSAGGRALLESGAVTDAAFVILLRLAAGWWLLALLWLLFAPQRVSRWATALAAVCSLPPTWIALTHIAEHWSRGTQWVLFIVVIAFAADTGAFFAGRAFGRTKLAPSVSPGKTWEGVIGGLLVVAGAALAGARWFGQPTAGFVLLCLLAAVFSVVGDLTESMFKRAGGVKDSGRLFPGHGGVLDRIDSLLAVTPIMALGLIQFGVGT
ncbi:MAG: phosphatidate cytidylyltransferase [Steroidobacteraceae bacterium]